MPTPHRKPAYAAAAHPMPHPMCTAPAIRMRRATAEEYNALAAALRQSGKEDGGAMALRMNPADTSFSGALTLDEYDQLCDRETIEAVRSVPTHY